MKQSAIAFGIIAGTILGCEGEAPEGPLTRDVGSPENTSTLVVTSSALDIVGTIDYTFRRFYPDKSDYTTGQLAEGLRPSSPAECGSSGGALHTLEAPGWIEIQATSELGFSWELDDPVEENECLEFELSLGKRKNNLALIYTWDIADEDLPAEVYVDDLLVGEVVASITEEQNDALIDGSSWHVHGSFETSKREGTLGGVHLCGSTLDSSGLAVRAAI